MISPAVEMRSGCSTSPERFWHRPRCWTPTGQSASAGRSRPWPSWSEEYPVRLYLVRTVTKSIVWPVVNFIWVMTVYISWCWGR